MKQVLKIGLVTKFIPNQSGLIESNRIISNQMYDWFNNQTNLIMSLNPD